MKVHAVDREHVAPLELPSRFRTEIVFFMTPAGERSAPTRLPEGDYWVEEEEARRWLDEGVFYVVSPLDAENQAEIELSEDHEIFLEWLVKHHVQHVRLA